MPRHYEDGLGILPIEWERGFPVRERGVVLVEVWQSDISFWPAMKPQILVAAEFQLWVHRDVTGWHQIQPNGDLKPIAKLPDVRRWTSFNGYNNWSGTIKLEGWDK